MSDNVYHPNHYVLNSVKLEPVELTARLPSAIGQAINYIMRCRFKGSYKDDLEKASNPDRYQGSTLLLDDIALVY